MRMILSLVVAVTAAIVIVLGAASTAEARASPDASGRQG